MILFLGDYEHQYYLEEPAREMGEEIQGSGQNLYHADLISDAAMSHDGCDIVVINIEAMTDIPQDIGDALEALQEETGAVIVIMDIGASMDSSVIGYLHRRGFRNFITSSVMGVAKEQARQALQNLGTTVDAGSAEAGAEDNWLDQDAAENPADEGQELFRSRKSSARIVTVAGCGRRVGATTHAVAASVFLSTFHKSCVYIEHNKSGWVDSLADLYGLEFSRSSRGMYTFRDVDLIRDGFDFRDLEPQEYDYVLLDCGNIYSKSFDKKAFLDSDIQIVVFGVNPGEGYDLARAFSRSGVHSMYYICTAAPEDQHVDIMSSFGEARNHVFFAPYEPDMFAYESDAAPMYARILKKRGEPFESEWKKELVIGNTKHIPVQPELETGKKHHRKHRRKAKQAV